MIIKEVAVTPEFKKDYEKLTKELKEEVKTILKSIEYSEKIKGAYHVPLRADLSGLTSVHFNNNSHRLIYREMKSKIKILALAVGPRNDEGNIYDKLRKIKAKRNL